MDKRKSKVSKKGKTLKNTNTKNLRNNRVCASGNRMPSRKELKAMYENDGEEIVSQVSSSAPERESQSTPVKDENSFVNGQEMISPKTLKLIAARALEYLRRTKLVPSANDIANVQRGLDFSLSNSVGVTSEHINEMPTKRRHEKKVIILGADNDSSDLPEICFGDEFSIRNSGDNKDVEAADSDCTVNYDINEFMNEKTANEVTRSSPEKSFSPIPSTSRNEKIFEQNDMIYEKCILQSKSNMSGVLKEANTYEEKVRTPSPAVKIESEELTVDSQLPSSSLETENKMQSFDKLLQQVDLEESDHEEVVIVNVEDVIQQNNALFQKFKSENCPKPEQLPLTNDINTDNRDLKSPRNVMPQEEVTITDGNGPRTRKREEQMSLVATNDDDDDVVIVNVEDAIMENNALFTKIKSENCPNPEQPLLASNSRTNNRNLKSLLNVTPKEEIIINDGDEGICTKKREEEMSLIVTNYFKQQSPIMINDTQDSESDECTSTSDDLNLLDTIVKYIASTQLVQKTKALVNKAIDSSVNKTTHRKRVNRTAGSCQIVDFVNLDNYASPIKATKAFSNEIIILDDSDVGTSLSNNNPNDAFVPSTSTNSENSPSTSQCLCKTSTPVNVRKDKQRNVKKRKHNENNLRIAIEDTPKKARTESSNEAGGTPVRNIGDCPICLEALSSKPISSTVCGHIFCLMCIQTIMKTSKRCPTCRKVLRGAKAYHPIFL